MIIALVTGGGYFVNTANVGVTEDKVAAIEDRLDRLEEEIKEETTLRNTHEKEFAHPGMTERTEQFQAILDSIDERIRWLERYTNGAELP